MHFSVNQPISIVFCAKIFQDEEELQDNINDLNTDITIKQKLIDELEHSQQRLTALKHQYEQKMSLLHNKIKETEDERSVCLFYPTEIYYNLYGSAFFGALI